MKKKSPDSRISVLKAVLFVVSVMLITVGATSVIYSAYKIVDYKEYSIYLETTRGNNIGFDIKVNAISFGKVPLGATGVIKVNLAHNFSQPLNIIMKPSGQAKKFIVITENNFVLEPGVPKKIEVYAVVPENSTLSNYTGKLGVVFRRI